MAEDLIKSNLDTIDYDYENDSLYFFIKGDKYEHSLNLDNIIVDFSKGDYIKGVEIQNASKRFGVSKYALKGIHNVNIELDITNEKIELKIALTLKIRNKAVPKATIAADINELNIPAGTMTMSCGVC